MGTLVTNNKAVTVTVTVNQEQNTHCKPSQ